MDKIGDILKNPPKEYRAVPFWSWNDKLEPEFLRWQIREMEKAGIGGYFMHARGGLETPYLSDEWMQCIEACIDEGKKLGMNSWCYDEEGWPSGFGGGIVSGMGDKYHVRWLEFEEVNGRELKQDEKLLSVCGLNREGKLFPVDISGDISHGQRLMTVRHCSNPYYIDILNEEVIRAFIENVYDKYYERFKDSFGNEMDGFFTDEPQYSRGRIPWSYRLPERFKDKFGYDIVKVLPALFIKCEGYEKIRYDFWSLVSELYVTAFGKQIYDWCEEHNCKLTGHVMLEDSLTAQMNATAGAMPFYEYMHIPGIDWLGRRISDPVTPKQVGSVACQLGKKFVLTETFACCGWDVNFEELKWIAEWQYVNGVNQMCQHLEGYTLRGLRKRDYPPSLFYQQSWWEEYRLFNDYFARLGVLLSEGKNLAGTLLLHPIKSAWIAYTTKDNEEMEKLDRDFVHATETLSGLHIDHHYGDETIIARHGRVEGKEFIVGGCRYKAVVIPSMTTIDKYTSELLNSFADNGGLVICLGAFPELCNGVRDEGLSSLKSKVEFSAESGGELRRMMEKHGIPNVSISTEEGEAGQIHYQMRDIDGSRVVFMVNHSQTETYNTKLALGGEWRARRYSAEKGEFEDIGFKHEGGSTVTGLDFLPMQSHIIVFDRKEVQEVEVQGGEHMEISPSEEWTIEGMDLNSLTLDYCSYNIDNSGWEKPVPVIKLMDILLKLKRSCNIALKFQFEAELDVKPNKEFMLVMEDPDKYAISINGKEIKYDGLGWWKDSTFKKLDIKPWVKPGINEILVSGTFYQRQKVYDVLFGENVLETERNKLTYDTELESIYIIGDFGVSSRSGYVYGERKAVFTEGPFVITDRPLAVKSGDLTVQGLNFFSGKIRLGQELEVNETQGAGRIVLALKRPNAAMSKVFINGECAAILPWAPYAVDITKFVRKGKNKLLLELYASNRNLLGPHHRAGGELHGVSPLSFTDKPSWTDGGSTELWKEIYCFVKFGAEK